MRRGELLQGRRTQQPMMWWWMQVDFVLTLVQIVGAICLWRGIWVRKRPPAVLNVLAVCGSRPDAACCRSAGACPQAYHRAEPCPAHHHQCSLRVAMPVLRRAGCASRDMVLGYSWESQVAGVMVGLAILLGMRVVRAPACLTAQGGSCVFTSVCLHRCALGEHQLLEPAMQDQRKTSCDRGSACGHGCTCVCHSRLHTAGWPAETVCRPALRLGSSRTAQGLGCPGMLPHVSEQALQRVCHSAAALNSLHDKGRTFSLSLACCKARHSGVVLLAEPQAQKKSVWCMLISGAHLMAR